MNASTAALLAFDNSYARLPPRFTAPWTPRSLASPRVLRVNAPVAALVGADPVRLGSPEAARALGGGAIPDGAAPIAMGYAGHQFGHFVPSLGDGRAVLLGEVVGPDGVRRDIHLKGSGRTHFSRGGDGFAALGPVLRELVVSEAMAGLGIPTSRALAVVATGETVPREGPKPGAVLARVAESHVRFGTFQFLRARDDLDGLRLLADYVIERHYPALAGGEDRYGELLAAVAGRTASLVAQWLLVGFIHGVMNTDNMSIAGETIDYGPCAFVDNYHPARVYSSIDQQGRYAYANQPHVAQWNLARLAEAMLPLLGADEAAAIERAHAALDRFPEVFNQAYAGGLRRKLGLAASEEGDVALARSLLEHMQLADADFTLAFRGLAELADGDAPAMDAMFAGPQAEGFAAWTARWRERLTREEAGARPSALILAANPLFIARNHLVEEAIVAAEQRNDLAPLDALLEVLARPFDAHPEQARLALPPRPDQVVAATFCGT